MKKVFLLLALIASGYGHSASFNCNKARSQNEHLICADSELSQLDDELGVVYAAAKLNATNKKAFQDRTVSEWRRRERECHGEKHCLLNWYSDRLGELSGMQRISGKIYSRTAEMVNGDWLPFTGMITNKNIRIYSDDCGGFVETNDIQLIGDNLEKYEGKRKSFNADCFCGIHQSHVRDITCSIAY